MKPIKMHPVPETEKQSPPQGSPNGRSRIRNEMYALLSNLEAIIEADPSGKLLFGSVQHLFHGIRDYETIAQVGRNVLESLRIFAGASKLAAILARPAATFVAAHCGRVALEVGETGDVFHWFKATIRTDITVNSLTHEKIKLEPMRFVELLCTSPPEFFSWVANAFYYSGRYGGLVEELKQIDNIVVLSLENRSELAQAFDNMAVLKALGGLAYYAVQYDRPTQFRIAHQIKEIRDQHEPSSYPWCFASLLLSQPIGRHVGAPPEFAADCLEMCNKTLHPVELMQAVAPFIAEGADLETLVKTLVSGLNRHHTGEADDSVTVRAEQARLFPAVSPVIKQLATLNRTDLALDILSAWANGDGVHDALVLMPYCEQGPVSFSYAGLQHKAVPEHNERIERLTNRFNDFARLTVALRTPGYILQAPQNEERRGIPTQSGNADLEELLKAVYCFRDIELANAQRMIVAPSTQHPVQALMLSILGTTLPLSSSFRRPAKNRVVKKVVLVVDDGFFSALEYETIRMVFTEYSIEIIVLEGDKRPAQELVVLVETKDPDVIWFIGHGEFDHFAAHRSAIISNVQLEWDHFEGLRDSSNNGRRLIVLNLCSGGAASTNDSPANIGVGPVMASPNNAVIGHLWDINPLFGATFGVLLALELGKHESFFEAFCAATRTLTKGRGEIESKLYDAGLCKFAERVENTESFCFDDIAAWGSPVFWE